MNRQTNCLNRRYRIVALYGVIGPLLGALVVMIGILASAENEDLAHLWEIAVMALVFSYPIGFIPAVAAGLTHIFTEPHLSRMGVVVAVCTVGVAAAFVPLFWLGNPDQAFDSVTSLTGFLLPPLIAALALSTYLTRHSAQRL